MPKLSRRRANGSGPTGFYQYAAFMAGVSAFCVASVNLVTDLIYGLVDSRVKHR